MDFKTWWYDTNTTKWQIIIGTLLVGLIFFGTFSFLDTYQFEEWKYSGFAKSMMGILMGTVALGVITGIIIIFQSIVAMDKEKNQKIFDERLNLYKEFIKKTMDIVSDNALDDSEREKLQIIEKEVLMIASPRTYRKWSSLYQDILKLSSKDVDSQEEILISISDKVNDFVNSCRIDLEIGIIDKETIEYTKAESRKELEKKFTISDFGSYESWIKQRLDNDKKLEPMNSDKSIHLDVYHFVIKEFPTLEVKFRKHGVALFHSNGKKVGNINLRSKYGTSLTLLRDEDNEYRFPNISHKCKNTRNDTGACEYYNIINIEKFDEEIKGVIWKSYQVRDDNRKLLKDLSQQKIKEILELN